MSGQKAIRYFRYAVILVGLFIVYNTLIPFQIYLDPAKIIRNLGQIEWLLIFQSGRYFSYTDLAGNILLFIPFGFLLYLYFSHLPAKKYILPKTVLFGFFFSLAIEISQLFFRYRVTSTFDLLNNTSGTLLGAFSAVIYLRYFEKRLRRWLHYILDNEPISLLILLILFTQIFSSLLPFNVSITISDLKHSIKYTNITPFAMEPLGLALGSTMKKLEMLRFSWLDFFENMIFYLMYGYVVLYAYFQYWKNRKYALIKMTVLLILFFPGIECLQLIIKSRFSDINDIVSAYFGAAAGTLLFFAVKKDHWFTHDNRINLQHFYVLMLVYLFFIFFKGMNPFNFRFTEQVIEMDLDIRRLVPFFSYYKVTSLWNIYDIIETFFVTMPLGLIWAVKKEQGADKRKTLIQTLILGMLYGLIIEIGQLFLPTRTADITDVLIGGIGCYLGARFYFYYAEHYLTQQNFDGMLKEDRFDPDAEFN